MSGGGGGGGGSWQALETLSPLLCERVRRRRKHDGSARLYIIIVVHNNSRRYRVHYSWHYAKLVGDRWLWKRPLSVKKKYIKIKKTVQNFRTEFDNPNNCFLVVHFWGGGGRVKERKVYKTSDSFVAFHLTTIHVILTSFHGQEKTSFCHANDRKSCPGFPIEFI